MLFPIYFGVSHKHRIKEPTSPGNKDPTQTFPEQSAPLRGSKAMSSHILMATVAAIALSTPAWADDPAKAPVDTEMKVILLDPAEAPIDTEMKIMFFRGDIEVPLWASIADGGGPRAAASTGPTIAEHRPAATNTE
jgi:hypothetical protein